MLHALDLPIPSNLEGQFASQALDQAVLAARPPRYADNEVVEHRTSCLPCSTKRLKSRF
jgi:hypothetical protein